MLILIMAAATVAAIDPDTDARAQFAAAWRGIHVNYAGEIDDDAMLAGAAQGMLASLGPHNDWISASKLGSMTQARAGIGVTLKIEFGLPTLVAAEPGGPAALAGLAGGDAILTIDDRPMLAVALAEVVSALQGAPGSPVRLRVSKPGADELASIELIRRPVEVHAVSTSVAGRTGIIRLKQFGRAAGEAVTEAIRDLDRQIPNRASGFVLDLRDNPGGLFDQAVAVADVFMDGGVVVTQRGRTPRDVAVYSAQHGDAATGRPLVVLVNGGSAAGSEIVAAALQDSKRARIVGAPTFGHGGVETVLPTSATSALRITTSRVFRPSGAGLQWRGVVPDVMIASPQSAVPVLRERDLRGSLPDPDAAPVPVPPPGPADGIDHQLQAAVALIGG